MLLYDVLQQGLPMNVVPDWIETKGTMNIVSLRPRYPIDYFSAFKISDGCLIVQDWTKYVMGEQRSTRGKQTDALPTIRRHVHMHAPT